jgi:hypothetical protein
MHDFWRECGYHLLTVRPDGRLQVTDDFLRAYWQRPEVQPVAESCAAERRLHRRLLDNPREAVSPERLAELADADARENYGVVLAFRERLLRAASIEDAYLGLFLESGQVPVPPLFVDQLAHVIIRHVLDGCTDPLRVRAGELFFREQAVTINEGFIMSADAETVEAHASTGGFGDLGRLVAQAQTPLRTVELDVLDADNAALYWERAERFDTVLNLNFAGAGLDAFCRVLEAWVRHFLEIEVTIQPVQQISDERWVWHIGLDIEASRLLDDLWNGVEVDEARLARLLSLFRLEFRDPGVMPSRIAGRPVYLALMMTPDKRLKLKPQNLLVNLPIATQG